MRQFMRCGFGLLTNSVYMRSLVFNRRFRVSAILTGSVAGGMTETFGNIKRRVALVAVAFASVWCAVSCADDPTVHTAADKGWLRIKGISSDVSMVERVSYAETDSYRVDIVNESGATVMSFEDSREMPEAVELDNGTYTAVAVSGKDADDWENPYLIGRETFEIRTGKATTVSIVCRIANVKVSVRFDGSVSEAFSSYKAIVRNNRNKASLTFSENEIRSGYFSDPGSLTWELDLVNKQGAVYKMRKTITGVKAREHYILTFKVSDSGEITDGGIHSSVTIDPNTDDIDHDITITPGRSPMGSFSSENVDLNGFAVIEFGEVTPARVDVEAQAGIDLLYITHYDKTLVAQGIPEFVNLTTADEATVAALNAAGLRWGGIGTASGFVDFSGITAGMKTGEHNITLMMLDSHCQLVEQVVCFNVRSSNANTATKGVEAFAKYAFVEAEWTSGVQPEGLTFEYRKDVGETWTALPESDIKIDGRRFTATIRGLVPDTKYKVRSRSADIEGNEMSFTTESVVLIPNLNMDSWSQSGKTWNPWGDGVEQYWDTGNSGVTIVKDSNTVPVDEPEAYKGRGVRMQSLWVDATVVRTFAAGNLFTGYFKTNISNPKSSPHFGRPYTGRPSGLRFFYKYSSTTINRGDAHIGEPDQMHVYISLEKWPDGTTERPSNPKVVGYGEFKTADNVTEYTEGGFDIEYTLEKDEAGNTIKPTHIVFVVTSSIYGADFIGGEGSTLYIDEFEMLFD